MIEHGHVIQSDYLAERMCQSLRQRDGFAHGCWRLIGKAKLPLRQRGMHVATNSGIMSGILESVPPMLVKIIERHAFLGMSKNRWKVV